MDGNLLVPGADLVWSASRASGAGGQNVNKVSSKVELRFNLSANRTLPERVRARLARLAGRRLDAEGRLLITSQRFRDQHRNLEDAREKLLRLIREALEEPRPRRKTRPTRASVERRLRAKTLRADVKKARQVGSPED